MSKIPMVRLRSTPFLFICSKISVSQCEKFVSRKVQCRAQTESFSAMLGGRKGNSYVIPVWSDKTVLEMFFVENTSFTTIFDELRTGAEFKSAFSTGNVLVKAHKHLPPRMKTFNFSQTRDELCCC